MSHYPTYFGYAVQATANSTVSSCSLAVSQVKSWFTLNVHYITKFNFYRNKTLHFAFMYIERGLTWYKELLQLSLFKERELNINPRNCVGTVLSLNGHRKYFCVFHAKHTESRSKAKVGTLICYLLYDIFVTGEAGRVKTKREGLRKWRFHRLQFRRIRLRIGRSVASGQFAWRAAQLAWSAVWGHHPTVSYQLLAGVSY